MSESTTIAFLFDLDGVLVDTARFHFVAWQRLANELGIEFTERHNESLKGVSRRESLMKILALGEKELEEEAIQDFMKLKNEWYLELVKTLTPEDILPGAQDFLIESRNKGIKTSLGSASKNAKMILSQLKIDHLLDEVVDGTTVSKSKPHPEVFLKGAELLNVDPSHCVVFEDAISGVEAAKAGGMKCVGIGSESELGAADIVVKSLANITVEEALKLL